MMHRVAFLNSQCYNYYAKIIRRSILMVYNTLTAQNMKEQAVSEIRDLKIDEIYEKLTYYINNANLTFWNQLKKFLFQKLEREIPDNEIKNEILKIAENNIIKLNDVFKTSNINEIRFFASTDKLTDILTDAENYDKYFSDEEYRNKYDERRNNYNNLYEKEKESFKNSDVYLDYLDKTEKYKKDLTIFNAKKKNYADKGLNFSELIKPQRPLKPKMESKLTRPDPFGREPTRYQVIFIGFALNCTAEEVEEIFLKKALQQRGFNLKNPLDYICYWALSQSTNRYGNWLKLKEQFYKTKIDFDILRKENANTVDNYNSCYPLVNEITDIEEVVDFIVSNMYVSDEIKNRIASNSTIVYGRDIIEYCLKAKNSNNVDCLSKNSVAALCEFKSILKKRYTDDIDGLRKRIEIVKNNELIVRENLINEAKNKADIGDFTKKDYFYLHRDIQNIIGSTKQKVNELHSHIKEAQKALDSFDAYVESEEMIGTVYYKSLNVMAYKLRAKGYFNESVLNNRRIKEILNEQISLSRDDIIMASFYIESINSNRTTLTREQRVNNFENRTNGYLVRSGFSKLYYPNPYEALLAIIVSTDYPISILSEILQKNRYSYINN